MEDFNQLFEKKQLLQEKKNQLKTELNSIEKQLLLCNNIIHTKCIQNGGHYFYKQRDYQLYGETTHICKICNFVK